MSSLKDDIVHSVDDQLRAMFQQPGMWGSEEAFEFQVLQLLEFRSMALRPGLEKQKPRSVLDTYHALLASEFPGAPPIYLFSLVKKFNRVDDFIPILRRLSERIGQDMTPEDVFMTHDLVLRLWLREDVSLPRALTLSSYYDVFHRVLRAVSRSRGTRGRASQDLERAIDFAMHDVVVRPANGAPANITLPLDEVETTYVEQVKHGLAQIAAVNEWAAIGESPLEDLAHDIPGDGAAQRIAAQALRLMPSQEALVQTVELGGKLMPRREPLTIRPHYAERLVEVVKQSPTLHDFDDYGEIRAIDIDQRSMKIRKGKRTLRCWMERADLLDVAEENLRQRVRVIGHEYRDPGSPPVVIVHRIVP